MQSRSTQHRHQSVLDLAPHAGVESHEFDAAVGAVHAPEETELVPVVPEVQHPLGVGLVVQFDQQSVRVGVVPLGRPDVTLCLHEARLGEPEDRDAVLVTIVQRRHGLEILLGLVELAQADCLKGVVATEVSLHRLRESRGVSQSDDRTAGILVQEKQREHVLEPDVRMDGLGGAVTDVLFRFGVCAVISPLVNEATELPGHLAVTLVHSSSLSRCT